MTRGAREPIADHLAKCRACKRAATRVERSGVVQVECCWCGAVHFGDGRLNPTRRVKVHGATPSTLPAGVIGDVERSPW